MYVIDKLKRSKKIIIYILLTFVFIFLLLISCSSLSIVRKTECKMENYPKLALIAFYESKVFNTDKPLGYSSDEIPVLIEELKRLGFDVYNIDPSLNNKISYAITSTVKQDKRVKLIKSNLSGSYDFLLYIDIISDYGSQAQQKDYRIKLISHIEFIGNKEDIAGNSADEITLDEIEAIYTDSTVKGRILSEERQNRYSLKKTSIEINENFILNFFNDYVKSVRNYEYVLEDEEPICFDFIIKNTNFS